MLEHLPVLGMAIAAGRGGRSISMLRISVEDEPQQVTLRLEGKLAGAWVKELEDSWREVGSTCTGRPLFIDLSAVEHVDQAGEYLLALVARRGVRLIASGVAMRDLCQKIEAGWPHTATTEH